METFALEPVTEANLDEAASLLERADLPTEDVHAQEVRLFHARADGEVVGVGGLEVYGSAALLRSVAVPPSARGEGYGTALVDSLEERASALGVAEIYLLTTTAAEFFGNRGYEEIDRGEPPRSIRETREFSSLCPDSATVMRKQLE